MPSKYQGRFVVPLFGTSESTDGVGTNAKHGAKGVNVMVRLYSAVALVLASWAMPGSAETHLGLTDKPLQITEISVRDGHFEEVESTFALPERLTEPLLVIYSPAKLSARQCVLSLVEPIRKADISFVPLRLVHVLDVSQLNSLVAWVVTSFYGNDAVRAANPRARFFTDQTGVVGKAWGLNDDTCAYTLHQDGQPPLSGIGIATPSFITALSARLLRGIADRRNP